MADGLWYSERLGGNTLNEEEKQRVFNYINQLK
ncbi:MAG: hypothetical protein KA434_01725 [Bacteroides sp.]|nr:hypothetical protein [Bacteroides sp.]